MYSIASSVRNSQSLELARRSFFGVHDVGRSSSLKLAGDAGAGAGVMTPPRSCFRAANVVISELRVKLIDEIEA